MADNGEAPAPSAPRPCVLVTGATGYIGGRLVPELLEAGYAVRALARTPEKLRDHPWAPHTEILCGDVTDAESVRAAMEGVEVAYYLVHALGSGRRFEDTDRRAAEIFADRARAAGVRRIVYLGGLGPQGVPERDLSPHLRSRAEVGDILLASGVPTAVLRAAVIIGSGSASFEMLRYLTERLPVMVTPSWVRTRIQPVAVRDVLRYLVGCARLPGDVSRTFDIGGPDILTYRDMMQRYARVAALPERLILPVPMLTPRLSSLWIGLVTPYPPAWPARWPNRCATRSSATSTTSPATSPTRTRRATPSPSTTRWNWRCAAYGTRRSPPAGPTPRYAAHRAIRCPPTPTGPVAASTPTGGSGPWTPRPRCCGGWSKASAATTAGTPSRSPGRCAAGWTGWSAGWGCAAADGTRAGCGSVTRSTSGASRRSCRAGCCGCAPRCAFPASPGWN